VEVPLGCDREVGSQGVRRLLPANVAFLGVVVRAILGAGDIGRRDREQAGRGLRAQERFHREAEA
jgi:hypothetical protein